MPAWLGKFVGAVLAYVGPLLLDWVRALIGKSSAKSQQNEAGEAVQKGDTIAIEEAINSPVASTPSGVEGAGIRERPAPPVKPE